MSLSRRAMAWLVPEWPGAALMVAAFLCILLPLWWISAGPLLGLTLAQLVIYTIHQGEEHIGDRFRRYVNQEIAGGREALSPEAVFWINSLGVWAIDLLSLWMAAVLDLGLGLIAVYLTLVNAVSHIVVGAVKRKYNPGLITSFVLFLPVGGWAITAINAAWPYHLLALVVAIAAHIAIVVHIRRRIAAIDARLL